MEYQWNPPYLGAAYYPEDWDEAEIDNDIAKMKEMGISVVRIGEFAWRKMEPKPGQFEFGWLHDVVDRLGHAGIAVILGTPTATPPIWLPKLHPDVFIEYEHGRTAQHGCRRHCCSNNPAYVRYSERIVRKMAEEFAVVPNVIGWQIDNEIYAWNGCFCEHCKAEFHRFLENKYGSISALNQAWNLNIFSQTYDAFEEIPLPRDASHNPHLRLDWKVMQNDSHIRFVHRQAEILHAYTKAPVGTDIMPFNGMDYRRLNSKLDLVQFNHYNLEENEYTCALWFDYLRNMRPRPFWVTETSTCWNGSTEIDQTLHPEGYCRLNSWLPIALGAEANLYWLWRTHWAGHELMHGAVLDTSGKYMHIAGEIKQTAEEFSKAADFINQTKVIPDLAIHFTSLNWNLFETQHVVKGLDYQAALNEYFYKPIIDSGLRPDFIDAQVDLTAYKLVLSPLMMTLEEDGLPEKIQSFVENGGVWVAGPFTDIRDSNGAKYKDRHFGMIESLTGIDWQYGIPENGRLLKAQWVDQTSCSIQTWADLWEDDRDGALARTTAGYSSVIGKTVYGKYRVGKGWVFLLGTIPSKEDIDRIIAMACETAAIPYRRSTGNIIVARRKGESEEGIILAEYAGIGGEYNLEESDGEMTDILSDRHFSGRIRLAPYEVLVLKSK